MPSKPLIGSTTEGSTAMNATTLSNAADWHATMAIKAYRKREWDTYRRHIRIADKLRRS